MEVESDGFGVEFGDEVFDVEVGVLEHLDCDVDNACVDACLFEVSDDADPAEGVHLEYGGGGDDVADGAVHGGAGSEVVDAGGVEEDEVGVGHFGSLSHLLGGILTVAWGCAMSGRV